MNINIFLTGGIAIIRPAFGEGSGRIVLSKVACMGDEAKLEACQSSNQTSSCKHTGDAGVVCIPG